MSKEKKTAPNPSEAAIAFVASILPQNWPIGMYYQRVAGDTAEDIKPENLRLVVVNFPEEALALFDDGARAHPDDFLSKKQQIIDGALNKQILTTRIKALQERVKNLTVVQQEATGKLTAVRGQFPQGDRLVLAAEEELNLAAATLLDTEKDLTRAQKEWEALG
jgi:hypothetical protein